MANTSKVAFCGLGLMGAPMAERLLATGHDLTVWNRTREKTEPLVAKGAAEAAAPAEAARHAGVVITMLATPEALEDVVFGSGGLAEGLHEGQTYLEMSTVGPAVVRDMAERLPDGVTVLDAPVLGSVPQATNGELKIFVGGPKDAFEVIRPVLEAMGTPERLGELGAGAAMKLVVNSTLGALMTGLGEALALGDALGLDTGLMLDVLAESAIGVAARGKRSMIESGRFEPPNFKVALAGKDLRLVSEAAEGAGVELKVAAAASQWFEQAEDHGLSDLDYAAVIAEIRHRPPGSKA
jgi:3-hydroxyisobutyrate dehydrogenase-like beta-hydroxyacid dehydrogenase